MSDYSEYGYGEAHCGDDSDDIGDDYSDGPWTEGNAEAFRLVKIKALSAINNGLVCDGCYNSADCLQYPCREDAWLAYGEDESLYCQDCWFSFDPSLIPCQICEADPQDVEVFYDEHEWEAMRYTLQDAALISDKGDITHFCTDCWRWADKQCKRINDAAIAKEMCAECGKTVQDNHDHAQVEGQRYCIDCYDEWLVGNNDVPPSKRKHGLNQKDTAAAANETRNEANRAVLKEAFPRHCDYHLYFHHVRGTRSCEFGDAEKCVKGSHAKPDGLNLAKRSLDLDISH